jgi:antitoxin component HigA of HigAB toxin-antitoxin module
MQIKNSIDKQADLIAQAVWRQMPELAPKAGEKTFDAVKRTLEIVDTLEDDVVESALLKENIEIKPFIAQLKLAGLEEDALTKFAAMYGTSTSDAARTLQSKSVISRLLNKVSALDKEAAREVDILFGKSNPILNSGNCRRRFGVCNIPCW